MTELMPAIEAEIIRESITDYLTTTFALTDESANQVLTAFLSDPSNGIFKGPYVRLRLPFQPSHSGGSGVEWVDTYSAATGWRPYGHQAQAFTRLASWEAGHAVRPRPTMVTTGTGSGKTEAFLYPILDHVLRAKRDGQRGVKALILYPMNALANDQAQRLARLITQRPELRGIRAGIYTGQKGAERSVVTSEGLISDRNVMREDPPDILLTNYKMLDQLLLRAKDQRIWQASADSLQYLVLDEFHTYDGAQGTDVAMLLRRLGMALRSYQDASLLSVEDRGRPLGRVTPVGTSATLGGDNAAKMRHFAETVFGEPFEEASIIGETRVDLDDWVGDASRQLAARGLESRPLSDVDVVAYAEGLSALGDRPDADALLRLTVPCLVREQSSTGAKEELAAEKVQQILADAHLLSTVLRGSKTVQKLLRITAQATLIADLPEVFLPVSTTRGRTWRHRKQDWEAFFRGLISTLGHVRSIQGRGFVSVEVHYWLRALSRIDRSAEAVPEFSWSDDGALAVDLEQGEQRPRYPAIYCRRCGRSGWEVSMAPVGEDQSHSDEGIRRDVASKQGRNRALIHAAGEAADALDGNDVEGLRWWDTRARSFSEEMPDAQSEDYQDGWVLPALINTGRDAEDAEKEDRCPACGQQDSIRFLGSAIATLLSVSLSTLFAAPDLDAEEKRALVFTDSVQDAAHRAGFVQARAHSLTLRSVLAEALGEEEMSLDALVDAVIAAAGDDPVLRYRLLPPEIAQWQTFRPFWEEGKWTSAQKRKAKERVVRRLRFDAALEFGVYSQVGRTLEMTGTSSAHVDAGTPLLLERIAQEAISAAGWQGSFEEMPADKLRRSQVAWVVGVLEHIRRSGGISHDWLSAYQKGDGQRYHIWGGRQRSEGMPAFPRGRSAPTFPRLGGQKGKGELEAAADPRSWYAIWSGQVLGLPSADGGRLTAALLKALEREGKLTSQHTGSGGEVFEIPYQSVVVRPVAVEDLHNGANMLECTVCSALTPGSTETIDALEGAPCLSTRCNGGLKRKDTIDGFYRRMYRGASMRRLVAREHTGLLNDEQRVEYENQFKAGSQDPSAPNVLVATPTLEMGIDIGDLSAVYLSSLPKTVASYTQRVGRAGRLNGSSLTVTFAEGRGRQLPRVLNPLTVIEGDVAPPTTYLSAEEILRRQYTAAIFDSFARDPRRPHPRTAASVMASADRESILAQVIAVAEEKGTILHQFHDAFLSVGDDSFDMVDQWISAPLGPGTSPFARRIADASARWNTEVDDLGYRIEELTAIIDELEAAANAPTASDDDKRALRAALASRRLANGRRKALQESYWISVLEEYGLLPNYTLLDDTTTLGIGVSQRDPDTGDYSAESVEVSRGAALAVTEFAPGAAFYTHGLEVTIDAVDLGPDAEGLSRWALCNQCGYSVVLSEDSAPPSSCPRCGSGGIADIGQQVELLELRRSTAEVRRDEATISDRSDDRTRKHFASLTTVDVDEQRQQGQWSEKVSGLGCAYYNQMTVRTMNLGRQGEGRSLEIAGNKIAPSLFTVCEGCGKLQRQGKDNRLPHRPWCKYRKGREAPERQIALTHTLETQGMVVYLPPSITLADSFAMFSLVAALRVGLRKVLGGDPDHLVIISASVPNPQGDGASDALILHDKIPGGTGYLTDWAQPQQLHRILTEAWNVVANCECRNDARQSCDRCLLPYAPLSNAEKISRASAETHLATLLGIGRDEDADPDFDRWHVEKGELPDMAEGESVLEHRFRKLLHQRLEAANARVVESVENGHPKLSITVPGAPRRWSLRAQVPMGSTQPDFVLETDDVNLPKVAIYTDGYQYHATEANNNLSDDALKRQGLREGVAGARIGVLAVTMRDVEEAADGVKTPPFVSEQVRRMLLESKTFTSAPRAFDRQGINPLDWLVAWIIDPIFEDMVAASRGVPLQVQAWGGTWAKAREGESNGAVVARLLRGAEAKVPQGPMKTGPIAWTGVGIGVAFGMDPARGIKDVAVVIDDRPGHVADINAWREWLRISNALIFREDLAEITTVSLAEEFADVTGGSQSVTDAAGDDDILVPQAWQEMIDDALDENESAALQALVRAGIQERPEIGEESKEGIPVDIGWQQRRVALDTGAMSEEDRQDLQTGGWTIVTLEAPNVAEELRDAGIR